MTDIQSTPASAESSTLPVNDPLLTEAGIDPAATQQISHLLHAGAVSPPAETPVAPEAHGFDLGGWFPDISSTFIVDGTLWTLIAFSAATWALILIKGLQHLRVGFSNGRYQKRFWRSHDLPTAVSVRGGGPIARVAGAGFTTLIETEGGASTHDLEHAGDRQELLERRLRQQVQKERGYLESGLAILATVGSISPFVGLFGTVWGIMGALTSISKSGSASLDVVAGPIGEALVATAIGIAVAVPAVIAYNFFIRRNKVAVAALDDFAIDFIHLALKTSFIISPRGDSEPETTNRQPLSPRNVSTAKPQADDTLIAKGAPA
ncbi:MAG: MotA/TolQ/ExbB proton channel family protein [Methylococcales bacterium]|nr:MotA/TolQ/ExbB proton channel family protein [Methylococcales bacterium]